MIKRLAPTRKPTMKDIRWAAAVYRGCSGSIQIYVQSADERVLDRLRDCFGGSVQMHGGRWCRWALSGARARGFVMTIYALLAPDKQWEIARALRGIEP